MNKILLLAATLLILLFSSCSDDDKDESQIDTTPISLYVGDTKKIKMSFVPTKTVAENGFIADVEKDGTIKGQHVGTTNIVIDDKYIISVNVKGKIVTYDDPITKWGCDASYIRQNQKQGELSNKSDEESIKYENCGKADLIVYMMENGKLASCGVVIKSEYVSEMGKYLTERYFMLPYDLGNYTMAGMDAYETKDAKTVAAIRVYSAKYLMVAYLPYKEEGVKSSSFIEKDNLIEKMNEIFNIYLHE